MPDRDKDTLSDRNRATQLTVRVPRGLKPRITAAAEQADETVSALVTTAIERELERRDSPAGTRDAERPAEITVGGVRIGITTDERQPPGIITVVSGGSVEHLRIGEPGGDHDERA